MTTAAVLLLFRHLHFFVIVSDLPQPPRVQLETKQYYVYADPLRLNVYAETGERLWNELVPVGGTFQRQLPAGPRTDGLGFYLLEADPGMNGATFSSDQPWAVLGSPNHQMGVNGPGPQLFFYVPPECAEFTLGAQSVSPNEGGRIVICDSQGREAAVLDGELDAEQTAKVTVPPEGRGGIWSLAWSKPQTAKAALDDLNFWLDGDLTPLLFPQREWAEKHGKLLWERDRAGREAEE